MKSFGILLPLIAWYEVFCGTFSFLFLLSEGISHFLLGINQTRNAGLLFGEFILFRWRLPTTTISSKAYNIYFSDYVVSVLCARSTKPHAQCRINYWICQTCCKFYRPNIYWVDLSIKSHCCENFSWKSVKILTVPTWKLINSVPKEYFLTFCHLQSK